MTVAGQHPFPRFPQSRYKRTKYIKDAVHLASSPS